MNLRIFETKDELIRGIARAIRLRIEGGTKTIGISGGTSPEPLYRLLGEDDDLRSRSLIWVLVDERYVPIDDPLSNAGMIQRTLFARGKSDAHEFLRFRTELGDPAATAREFEREWRALHIEQLDLVLLGMGDDGHTASLFPGTTVIDVVDGIAAEVYVPRMNSWRVTLTKPVLRDATMRFVLTAGASKRRVLEEIRSGADYPITQVTSGVETWWFVDRASVDSSE